MKFKNKKDTNDLYVEIRYNKNTIGTHETVIPSHSNMDKRNQGIISIFSLMTISGYYEKAEKELKDKTPINIVNRMLDDSEKIVSNTFVKEDNYNYKRGI